MEIASTILLAIMAFTNILTLVGVAFCAFILYKKPEPTPPPTIKTTFGTDQYTPEDVDSTVPLEQFTPDFSKPIKVVYREEPNGDRITSVE